MAALVAARRPGALAFLEPMGWGSECFHLPEKEGINCRKNRELGLANWHDLGSLSQVVVMVVRFSVIACLTSPREKKLDVAAK